MVAKLRSWWQKTGSILYWLWQKIQQHPIATGVLVVLFALVVFIFAVYKFGWDWTGFTSGFGKITTTSTSNGITTATEKLPERTFLDWLQLLGALAIPVVVGFGTVWFTTKQGQVSNEENKDNQREAALQAYLNNMSELLLKEKLRESAEDAEVRKIARARTLTVLRGLDAVRKASVLQFLYESDLIDKDKYIIDLGGADLSGANIGRAHLFGSNLRAANLGKANLLGAYLESAYLAGANLRGADLRQADLIQTDLFRANLSGANLSMAGFYRANLLQASLEGADLRAANLLQANLNGANLRGANLSSRADLSEADLSRADMGRANLSGANLGGADLSGAVMLEANLSGAELLLAEQALQTHR
jgi:uncharacterized protein YjbI with pentapeptide repeats